MKFSVVANCFEHIEQETARTAITVLLADLFKKTDPQEARIIANIALGQLHPPYIGTQFNIAEKNVVKALAQVLSLPEKEVSTYAKQLGDLGLVVQEGHTRQTSSLSVEQVYVSLQSLEELEGAGSQEEKINTLANLIANVDAISAKYIIRIILGKLRLGFSDMTIIDALSWMAVGDKSVRAIIENAYNICVDIGLIAQTMKEKGVDGLAHMQITVGIPIRPAGAERLPTAQAIIDKIGPCVAQPKLDGFRLQIHIHKDANKKVQVHFFSRNLIDMSHMFPDLTKIMSELPVKELICEGEAIVYDANTDTFLPFQETVKRKRKHDIEQFMQELPLRVYLFDILYYNGTVLLTLGHEQRRAYLAQLLAKNTNTSIQLIEEEAIDSAAALNTYFAKTVAIGLEGLVVKRPDAPYQPGKRNFNWIKLKRQEEGHLEDTVDTVILGYYAGEGKRAQFGVGAFLVGVYSGDNDCFETIAKIGTGLSDQQWKELKKKCDARAVDHKPKNVRCEKELYPDVWVYPEIVCAIRADEITISPLHTAGKKDDTLGYALRFPRFIDYRVDKSAQEATTVSEIVRLYEDQFKNNK
jgi:DNA ligase 1